jgi:hypothetical protein
MLVAAAATRHRGATMNPAAMIPPMLLLCLLAAGLGAAEKPVE